MDLRRRVTRPRDQPRRIAFYLLALVGVVVIYVLAYSAGMAVFENRQVTLTAALLAVVESLTTTGFGEAAHLWTTWQMRVLMVGIQLTGVALIFLALPLIVAPWLEERITMVVPNAVEDRSDHVVICGYTSRTESLVDELLAHHHDHVVIVEDREEASNLYADGVDVIHADPTTEEGLRAACLGDSRSLVADVDDEANASIALTARAIDGVPVVTFVEDSAVAEYHTYAGASEVFSPRQLIGRSLARKVTASITRELGDAVEIGDGFDIVELPVQAGSELAGKTVADSGVRERAGTSIIGMWSRGEFLSPPEPDTLIDEQAVLVVAGHEEQLSHLKELTLSEERRRDSERVIVAGHGEVGSTVAAELRDSGMTPVVVDLEGGDGVDVVGDATDQDTLEAAGIDEAGTVILALGDDTEEVFANLVVRELAPNVEIVARAESAESVSKLYQAGADYVLSLSTVAGRMLASEVLAEDVISFDNQVELVRTDCGGLAGQSLRDADVRARTGCTIVAVERDGEAITTLDSSFVFEDGDDLVVAGTDEDINRFQVLLDA